MIPSSILKQVSKPSKYLVVEKNPYTIAENLEDIALLNFGSYESSISQINFQILYSIFAESKQFYPNRFFVPDDDFLSLTSHLDYRPASLDTDKNINEFEILIGYLNDDESILRYLKFQHAYQIQQRLIVIQRSNVIHPLIRDLADLILIGDDLFKLKAALKEADTVDSIFTFFKKHAENKVVSLAKLNGFGSITKFVEPIINVKTNANLFSYIYNSFENNYSDLFESKGNAGNFSMLLQAQKRLNERIANVANEGEIYLFPLGISKRIRHYLNVQKSYLDIVQTVKKSLSMGWRTIHLFYWIGHPLESAEDERLYKKEIQEIEDYIADFKKITVQLHISPFVPAAKSEFLWDELISPADYLKRKEQINKLIENKADMTAHYEAFSAYMNRLFAMRANEEQASILAENLRRYITDNRLEDHELFFSELLEHNPELASLFSAQAFDRQFPNIFSMSENELIELQEKRKTVSKQLIDEQFSSESDFNINLIKKALPNLNCELRKTLDAAATVLSEGEITYGRSEKRRASQQQEFAKKYRIRFSKTGEMSFFTYQDVRTLFLKCFEQCKLAVVMTKGFKPHPKIAFAAPASIGVESEAEYFDVEINMIQTIDFASVLNPVLPNGIQVLESVEIPIKHESLAASINLNEYRFDFSETDLASNDVKNWYSQQEIAMERDSKNATLSLDLKTYVHEFQEIADRVFLFKLISLDNRLIKTDEILNSINQFRPFKLYHTKILRLRQLTYVNDQYLNPIEKQAI